jgi:hypothetical protein
MWKAGGLLLCEWVGARPLRLCMYRVLVKNQNVGSTAVVFQAQAEAPMQLPLRCATARACCGKACVQHVHMIIAAVPPAGNWCWHQTEPSQTRAPLVFPHPAYRCLHWAHSLWEKDSKAIGAALTIRPWQRPTCTSCSTCVLPSWSTTHRQTHRHHACITPLTAWRE